MARVKTTTTQLGPVSNGGERDIAFTQPFACKVAIEGVAPLLFHAWNVEAVKEKAGAAKGSKSKKEDNINSYVHWNTDGEICIPGEYFRQSVIHAAKYLQDPRSPRKSAMDLFKAGVVVHTELAPVISGRAEASRREDGLGVARPAKAWDYLDQRRVVVQRNGVNRVRPAMLKGWQAIFDLEVILPEYISRDILGAAITNAGRLVGVGDFRPTYGRFLIREYV
jgi:hypothetical protein